VEGDAAALAEPTRSRLTRLLHRDASHPASTAVCLFVSRESLPEPVVRDLLGPGLLATCRDAGLLVEADGLLASPYRLDLVNGLYLFADQRTTAPDSVMPVGESTQLLVQASYPQGDVEEALDLGCGNGVIALLLAGGARRVVATDANPRAVALARFNAALNGIANVELLEGDLWAPLDGRRFDLVVSQPPFHACPPGVEPVRFLHGGARGDELALRVLSGMAPHLSRAGRGFVLGDFPWEEGLPLAATLRPAVGDEAAGLLVLRLEALVGADVEAARLASLAEPDDDDAFGRAYVRTRSHLARLGIDRIQQALVVVEAAGEGEGRTLEYSIPAESWRSLRRPFVDELLACGDADPALPGGSKRR